MFSGYDAKRRTVATGITSNATIGRTPIILMVTAMIADTLARSTLTVAASSRCQIHHSAPSVAAPPPPDDRQVCTGQSENFSEQPGAQAHAHARHEGEHRQAEGESDMGEEAKQGVGGQED